MTNSSDLPSVRPADRYPAPRPKSVGLLFVTSCFFNFLFLIAVCLGLFGYMMSGGFGDSSAAALKEQHHSGKESASDKIAVVKIEGVLMEGLIRYAEKQLDKAAADPNVKAVVLRINSPGGSITASDALYRKIMLLQDGDPAKGTPAKPVVVSMAGIAASGGYYIAAPAKTIYAERTTLTGSIGVYVALPNIKELTDKYGFKMEVVKRGAVKYSGSPFADFKPEERAMWQEMVDNAYDQFKEIVEKGRPQLKGKLEDKVIDEKRTVEVEGKPVPIQYVRQRADGGTFTADQALKFELVDKIGYLEDAIQEAHDQAGLGKEYQAVTYERPYSLVESLLGVKAPARTPQGDLEKVIAGMEPRLWYLAPQYELAGMMSSGGR